MLSLKIEDRKLRSAVRVLSGASALVSTEIIRSAGLRILVHAIAEEAPVKTGTLQASVTSRHDGVYSVYYGPYVAEGTRPHTIVPRNGQFLVFDVGGKTVFARSVQHPGTQPNDFVQRGVDNAIPALRVLMVENGRKLVNIS